MNNMQATPPGYIGMQSWQRKCITLSELLEHVFISLEVVDTQHAPPFFSSKQTTQRPRTLSCLTWEAMVVGLRIRKDMGEKSESKGELQLINFQVNPVCHLWTSITGDGSLRNQIPEQRQVAFLDQQPLDFVLRVQRYVVIPWTICEFLVKEDEFELPGFIIQGSYPEVHFGLGFLTFGDAPTVSMDQNLVYASNG